MRAVSRIVAILGLLLWHLAAGPALAEEIVVTHTYLMGDNDTKIQARAACLAEAKRAILEQAGTVSRVFSEMRDFELTRDVVQSFSAALVKTTLLKEETAMAGQNLALTCTVAGEVDLASLEAQAKKLLESRMTPLAAGGEAPSSPRGAPGVPKSLPNQPESVLLQERLALRSQMLAEQRDATFLAANLPEKGMTPDQVAQLAGEPAAKVEGPGAQCFGYGRTWVVYQHGRLACIRRALSWSKTRQSDCHCDGFAGDFHLR